VHGLRAAPDPAARNRRLTRRRTDRLYPRTFGPREQEALRLVEQRPGITVAELADELGVTMIARGRSRRGSRRDGCGWSAGGSRGRRCPRTEGVRHCGINSDSQSRSCVDQHPSMAPETGPSSFSGAVPTSPHASIRGGAGSIVIRKRPPWQRRLTFSRLPRRRIACSRTRRSPGGSCARMLR
jgi:hypothetical protein